MQHSTQPADKSRIVFLGDSRLRDMYYEFVNILSDSQIPNVVKHSDLRFVDNKSNLVVVSIYISYLKLYVHQAGLSAQPKKGIGVWLYVCVYKFMETPKYLSSFDFMLWCN